MNVSQSQYSEPVRQLLTYGDARQLRKWPNYQECGLSQAHIPELITMLTDEDLNWADSNSVEVWAPLHAWRALGQLHAVEAIAPLLDQLYRIDAYNDDWIGEEFPEVFAMIGAPAIPAVTQYLRTPHHGLFARVCAAHSLATIGRTSPDTRAQCIESLTQQLTNCGQNDPTLNGFLVSYLVDLHAVEALTTIQQAYHQECVDLSIIGDCEEAEIELGVRKVRATPRPRMGWLFGEDAPAPATFAPAPTPQKAAVRVRRKIGRNDPCPCGSGKKYKKCCLNKS